MPSITELADVLVKCRLITRNQWDEAAEAGRGNLVRILDYLTSNPPSWWEGSPPSPPGLTDYQRDIIQARFADDELHLLRRDLALNQFLLLDKLGHGGQGEVFYSRQLNPPRFAAVKILSRDTENSRRRFEQEARAMIKIQHPAVARFQLYERIRDVDGSPTDEYLIAMEFVSGTDLHRLVRRVGPIPWQFAVQWIIDLLGGLMVIHENGFIHRDVKPENVMIVGPAPGPGVAPVATSAKLLDFGAVKQVGERIDGASPAPRVFVGTMEYAAPEQWNGEIVVSSDVYALGGTLFYALTGRHPYMKERRDPVAYRHAHVKEDVPDLQAYDPRVSRDLNQLFRRMMAKDPEERGTAAELRDEFRLLLPTEASAIPIPSSTTRTKPPTPKVAPEASQPLLTNLPTESPQPSNPSLDPLLSFLERIFVPDHLRPHRGKKLTSLERLGVLLRRPPVFLILAAVILLLIICAW